MQYDLLTRLKNETAERHTRLESALDLMRADWPRDAYIALLEGFRGYIAPWENAAGERMPEHLRDFFDARRKAHLLDADLVSLNGRSASAPVIALHALPALDNLGRVFGSMYVMEGSTLGGRFIAPHVARLFGLATGVGNAYFEGYGARTGSMWNAFRETAAASVPAHEYDDAVAAACETFDTMHTWLTAALKRADASEKVA